MTPAPRFFIQDFDHHGLNGRENWFCVVDDAQIGSDGERLIVGTYADAITAEIVHAALVRCFGDTHAETCDMDEDCTCRLNVSEIGSSVLVAALSRFILDNPPSPARDAAEGLVQTLEFSRAER